MKLIYAGLVKAVLVSIGFGYDISKVTSAATLAHAGHDHALMASAAPVANKSVPFVRHVKLPSGGYVEGSPLYAKQQRIASQEAATEGEETEANSVAWMLVGSISFVMALFYLVNHQKTTIQKGTWKTLNMTISIFAAVMLYSQLKEYILFVMACIFGEFGETGESIVTMAVFFLFYGLNSVILHLFIKKASLKKMQAVGILSSHVVGFAAMYAFAALQEHASSWLGSFAVVFIAVLVLAVSSFLNEVFRQVVVNWDGKEDEEEEHWVEQSEETENDVLAFSIGFLVMQTIRHAISGKSEPYEPAEPPENVTQLDTSLLLLASVCCVALQYGLNMASYRLIDGKHIESEHVKRLLRVTQDVFAMCMAWCLLFWGEWQLYTWGFQRSRMFGVLLLALMITAIALVLIFVVDAVADQMKTGRGKRSMRRIELALGMLVGFSWEKAFDVATECIVDYVEKQATLMPGWVAELILVVGSLAIVVPAWYWYILPKALDELA